MPGDDDETRTRAPVAQAAPEALDDADPVGPEEAQQHEGRRQVGRDEEGEEVLVVLMDVPPEQPRQDDAVAEARDGKELREALEQSDHDRLEVGDHRRAAGAGSGILGSRAGLEPGVGEETEGDHEGRDAVLEVMMV